jgi:hypothetical protein
VVAVVDELRQHRAAGFGLFQRLSHQVIGQAQRFFLSHLGDHRASCYARSKVSACTTTRLAGARLRPPEHAANRQERTNVAQLGKARLAAARGDTATAISALRRAADSGRRVASVMFVPSALACTAAIAGDPFTALAAVGEARVELGGRRQAITAAARQAGG